MIGGITMKFEKNLCPVCGKYTFKDSYEVCEVCFWENEESANRLSLKDYKKRWERLNLIVPPLIEKYNIKKRKGSLWTYDKLNVPRRHIKEFVDVLTRNNIGIVLSFYYLCKKYNLNKHSFRGCPFLGKKSIKENNEECLKIIFSNDPVATCKKYNLSDLLKILEKEEDVNKRWKGWTPAICVDPNPYEA